MLELGKGFTYIGNQHRLEFNGKEYFVDMLFFHRGLRSLVAIELKIGSFKAEYVGKMNLYLSLLDKLEKNQRNLVISKSRDADKKELKDCTDCREKNQRNLVIRKSRDADKKGLKDYIDCREKISEIL